MPRWLSEGISVYEEMEQNQTWGQSMSPQYRQMILGDELTPVSRLTSAFASPRSALHLQFAYYESSLVVRYIVDTYGFDTLKKILDDLGIGMPINEALTRYIGSLNVIDEKFAEYARELAKQYGSEKAWAREGDEVPKIDPSDPFAQLISTSPTYFEQLSSKASRQVAAKEWSDALTTIEELESLFSEGDLPVSVLMLKSNAYQGADDLEGERTTLEIVASRSSDAVSAYTRLVEIAIEDEDWEAVTRFSEKLLSVNPLLSSVQESAALAASKLDRHSESVRALRALAEMEPIDPAGLHYKLARSLSKVGDKQAARLEVLKSLEEAPRYRDAQRLLLDLVRGKEEADPAITLGHSISESEPSASNVMTSPRVNETLAESEE